MRVLPASTFGQGARGVTVDLVGRLGVVAADPARRLRDAAEPLAMHASGSAAVRGVLAGLGLDRFQAYVWARAASLGEPVPEVVVAAFAVFEPENLAATYQAARDICARTTLLETRTAATVQSLHAVLGDEKVDHAVTALRRGLSAAPCTGRPLFSGLASLRWPQDPLGRLWRACELLREHRGDTHLRLCVSQGLDPVEMNVLTELWLGMPLGRYTRTRGWHDQIIARAVDRLARRGLIETGTLTAEGWALRAAVEEATNLGQRSVVEAIGTDVERLVAALASWSARCIAAGTFTTDEEKRAAG